MGGMGGGEDWEACKNEDESKRHFLFCFFFFNLRKFLLIIDNIIIQTASVYSLKNIGKKKRISVTLLIRLNARLRNPPLRCVQDTRLNLQGRFWRSDALYHRLFLPPISPRFEIHFLLSRVGNISQLLQTSNLKTELAFPTKKGSKTRSYRKLE